MFGVTVLLVYELTTNQFQSRRDSMTHQDVVVDLYVHDTVNFHEFAHAISRNGTPNHNGTSTVLYCGCSASSIKTFSRFSVIILTKDFKLRLISPKYLIPDIYSPVFVLPG